VRLQLLMPEGRSAPLAELNGIHAKLGESLIAHVVDEPLRPYFDALKSRSSGEAFAGFKFTRPDEDEAGALVEDEEKTPLFFWFFFPLSNGIVAWEATTVTGRATYFFKGGSAAVESLTRGLALVNFRREPVYLPDESLDAQPRYHRYAIGARKLPELRALRAAYAGRAIHSSVEVWAAQVPV